MKKRSRMHQLAAIGMAGLLALSLTGCQSGGSKATASGKKSDTISIMVPATPADKQLTWYNEIVDDFNQNNTLGVTAELQTYEMEQYKTKLTTLMATNTVTDVFLTWELDYIKPFVEGGKVLPLNDYMEKDAEWKNCFAEGVLDPLTFDGKIYGVADAKAVCVMYYNKDLFEQAKAKVPTTYDEFIKACDQLKAAKITPMTMSGQDSWIPAEFVQQLSNGIGGNAVYSGLLNGSTPWNNEAFVEAGEDIQSMADAGYFQDGYLGMDQVEARKLFLDGKAAMYYMGSWDTATVDSKDNAIAGKVGAFALPAKNAANQDVIVGSLDNCFAVSANSKNPKAAVEFVKMFSSETYQEKYVYDYGNIPIRNIDIDPTKVSALFSDVIAISQNSQTLTPWLDRAFGAGEGVEFNTKAQAILGGNDSKEQFDALAKFAKENQER